jgi:hypothetical protein
MELHKLQDQCCSNKYFYQFFTQHSREADLRTQQIRRRFSIITAAARRIEGAHLSSKTDRGKGAGRRVGRRAGRRRALSPQAGRGRAASGCCGAGRPVAGWEGSTPSHRRERRPPLGCSRADCSGRSCGREGRRDSRDPAPASWAKRMRSP